MENLSTINDPTFCPALSAISNTKQDKPSNGCDDNCLIVVKTVYSLNPR